MFSSYKSPRFQGSSTQSIVCLHCLDIIGEPNKEQECSCKSIKTISTDSIFKLEIKPNAKYAPIKKSIYSSIQTLYEYIGPRDITNDEEYCECCKMWHHCGTVKVIRNRQGFIVRCCANCNNGD